MNVGKLPSCFELVHQTDAVSLGRAFLSLGRAGAGLRGPGAQLFGVVGSTGNGDGDELLPPGLRGPRPRRGEEATTFCCG